MSPRRVQLASSGFANYVVSESHLMMDQRQRSRARVCYVGYCNDSYWQAATTANWCSMLPPVWWVTRKFGRGLTTVLHSELHWLDVPERVSFKLGVMVYGCLHGQTPRYLADHLITSSDVASRLRLRHQFIVPRCRLNSYGRRAFLIPGPTFRNSLPDELRDLVILTV